MHSPARWSRWLLGLVTILTLATATRADDETKPALFKELKFRSIGPGVGGRVSRACGVVGDPLTYYAAVSQGGVWKSADGGLTWKPIFDRQPTQAVGSIAVAASDPNVIYVGSGEANIRGNVAPGNGIYKSEDAGKTWKHVWKAPGQIGTMIVDPKNAEVAYAAVLGSAFAPGEQRGIYRTTDGGKTWKRVLYRDADTGASDLALDMKSPKVLFAGLWQARRTPWELTSGGPGSGLYSSRDGGDTWTQLVPESAPKGKGRKRSRGLPEGVWGKVCVAVAPSDGRRVYAMIEADKGGLFRSDDGGETWEKVSDSRALRQRAWYFNTVTVHPTNPDVVYCPQVPLLRSIDGGKTFHRVKGPHHGDHHDVWIDPENPKRIIDSNDGGVDISLNGGETWTAPVLPIAQFYHIETDSHVPYRVMGSMQDIGTGRGPSNSLSSGGILLSDWLYVGGGEAGHVEPDPSDPNIVYAGEYGGIITRHDARTRQARNVSVYPFNPSGHDPKNLKYRFQWTAPILVSKHDPKVVYHAANFLFMSNDSGESWKPISPDLTRDDKAKQNWSGGPITGDNTGVEVYCTIFALAESPLQKGLLWVGSDDGLVHVTTDGGKKWVNVTPGIDLMPKWATVRCVEPSPFDASTAYLVAHNYRLGDDKPYLFKTTDLGRTWKPLTAKLPADVFLHCVRCDPKKKGLLYLGTQTGLSFSADDGATWQELKLNLPAVAVSDLKVKNNDLVLGTHGRSIWVLDDLTPVRQFSTGQPNDEVAFLPPLPVTRWRYDSRLENSRSKGSKNPPEGAVLHFYFREKPKGEVTVEVLNEAGKKVSTLSSKKAEPQAPDEGSYSGKYYTPEPLPKKEGLHRYVWDLRHDGARLIKGARFDSGQAQEGPFVSPGKYSLKLTADGRTITRSLEVKPDPRLKLAPDALAREEQLALRIRDDISRLADITNRLRSVRDQIQARDKLLAETTAALALVKASEDVVKKLDALEEKLHNPKAKTVYDILAQRGGAKLYSQLAYLLEQLKESDGVPTPGVQKIYAEQGEILRGLEKEWHALVNGDVAALNVLAKKLDVPGIIVPK
jgi:photosystem II stability/assembly factor-like uncharacterized protein